MFDVENKIKDNLAYFNDNEPDQGHKARFASRLSDNSNVGAKKIRIQLFFKIAATFLLLIATSYLILKTVNSNIEVEKQLITQIEYSDDLKQVQSYYDELSMIGLNQIDDLAQSEDEAQKLKTITQKKFNKLDANLAMIEKEYVKNPQCDKLKAAIVNNKKMKVEVVNSIIEQLDNAQQGYHAGSMYTNY